MKVITKAVGTPFWGGTVLFWLLGTVTLAVATRDAVLTIFPPIVFCWVGGLVTQCIADLWRTRGLPRFRRTVWRWALAMLAYYVLAGLAYWLFLFHLPGNWGFFAALLVGMLPLARLQSHCLIENERQREHRKTEEANNEIHPTN